MVRPSLRAAIGALSAATLVGTGLAVSLGAAPASASPTQDYFTTPGTFDWTVPAGVSTVEIEVNGAQGGDGANGAVGGLGGRMIAEFTVVPGDTVKVHVGAQGTLNGTAGANGGGDAHTTCSFLAGGSGGDASDVRLIGDTLNDRLIVAGGGGGGGGASTSTDGGEGGGDTPTDAADANVSTAQGGKAATGSAGGVGGAGFDNGQDGSFGVGGDAGNDTCTSAGGGGGGAYGGGGGGQAAPSQSGGGGGGSGYTSLSSNLIAAANGVQSGDGAVVFTYTVVPPTTTTTTEAPTTTTTTTVPAPAPAPAPTKPACPAPVPPLRIYGNAFSMDVAKFLVDDCKASTRAVAASGELFWVVDPPATSACPAWRPVRIVMSSGSVLLGKHLLDNCKFTVRLQKEGKDGVVYVVPAGYPAGKVTV